MEKIHRLHLRHTMARSNLVIVSLMALSLLVACVPQNVKTEPLQRPARTILILTGTGMVVSSKDDPRYEKTWLDVAKKFTDGLSEAITGAGLNAQVHIKQNRDETPTAALRRLITKEKKDAVITVTVHHTRNSLENTVYLKAKLMPLENVEDSKGARRVTTQIGTEKDYPILSTTKPDMREASIPDLGKQFVRELQEQGYLQ